MTENKRFVKYDGNTIVDLKLVRSWVISNGDVDELLRKLNDKDLEIVEKLELSQRNRDEITKMTGYKRFDIYFDDYMQLWTVSDNENDNMLYPCTSENMANEFAELLNELDDKNKKFLQELKYYKQQVISENAKWLKENTVWEQMPTSIRTITKTS